MNIKEFLLARIAEDEAVARAAVDEDAPGLVWHWETTETDTPVPSRDLAEAQRYQKVSLRSTEEFPSSAGPLPFFAIGRAEDVHPGVGALIARHDPARALAECAAKRVIIERCERLEAKALNDDLWNVDEYDSILEALAAVYADHPDYQKEWVA